MNRNSTCISAHSRNWTSFHSWNYRWDWSNWLFWWWNQDS